MDKWTRFLILPWAWVVRFGKFIIDNWFTKPTLELPKENHMFQRVRDLIAKGQQLADKADSKLDQAQLVLDLAKAFIDDFQDGFAVKFQLDDNAAKQFLALLTGKSGEIPVSITVDPSWDVLPSQVAEFKGGPYDGKKFVIPKQQTELVLVGNHRYKWNGKLFMYVISKA